MGIDNLKEFTVNLEKFGQITVEQHRQICSKLAFDGTSKLINRSPVDKFRFRAGWLPSEGTPSSYVPEDGLDSYPMPDIGQIKSICENVAQFPTIYITNNVEYGPALAKGHSPQAPDGWVDVIVEELATFGAAKS